MHVTRKSLIAVAVVAVAVVGLSAAATAAQSSDSEDPMGSLVDDPPPVDLAKVNAPGTVTREFHIDSSASIDEQVKQAMTGGDMSEENARRLVMMDPRNAGK